MHLLYFARLREHIGQSSEEISLPGEVKTVADLLVYLRGCGAAYEKALADENLIRVAVNEVYVTFDHPVSDSDEVALFPPMTGGQA